MVSGFLIGGLVFRYSLPGHQLCASGTAILTGMERVMERQELEDMGFWERQVACSKLWDELSTTVYGLKDNKGRTPPDGKVRKTDWPGCWLYLDDEGYRLIEDQDMEGWVLVKSQ